MTTEFLPLTLLGTDKTPYSAQWRLEGETLEWQIDGTSYRIQSERDLATNVITFLKVLSRRVLHDEITLEACLTCRHFQMSSMARDMGRGQRGSCRLHQQAAEICYRCDDYTAP
ncbi:hypothetical protein [Blastopirellula marina]|nr:hypothetical protein [Blastopirellula marina]